MLRKTVFRLTALTVCCLLLCGCGSAGVSSAVSQILSVPSPQTSVYEPASEAVPTSLPQSSAPSVVTSVMPSEAASVSSKVSAVTSSKVFSAATSSKVFSNVSSSKTSSAASVVSSPPAVSSSQTAVTSSPSSAVSSKPNAVSSEPIAVSPPAAQSSQQRGVWISYYELEGITDYSAYKTRINTMFDNIAAQGLNTVYFHVRPMSDALYPSEIFPFSHVIGFTVAGKAVQGVDPGYDPLAYAITAAHARGLQLHAWINPYRVWTLSANAEELSDKNPAKKWLTDEDDTNDTWVCAWENKLYYNPGVAEVRKLIVDGVKEIVSRYAVDGIHFDDYFYPTTSASFDKITYQKYTASGGKLSLDDWRRDNVNQLVREVCTAVHSLRDIPFGISPGGNIARDREEMYADVKLWTQKSGYIDYICPQIYFGFTHKTMPFEGTLDDWLALVTNAKVKIYIGLPVYKLGAVDSYAGTESAKNEFITQKKIISRMAAMLAQKGADGYVLYSYTAMTASQNAAEMEALRDLLQ